MRHAHGRHGADVRENDPGWRLPGAECNVLTPAHMDKSSFEDEWRRRFDEFAETRDSDASIAGWSETGLDARVRAFVRSWMGRPQGERWLDLGCGAGTYTRLLTEQTLDVIGVDYSPRSLGKAESRSKAAIQWVCADARSLPFGNESFDGLLCFGVTQALSETLPVVAEAARVLRPGGELWIDALNGACLANVASVVKRRLTGLPSHLRYERVGQVKRALRQAGFSQPSVAWLPLAPARFRMLQRLFESRASEAILRAVPPIASVISHSFIVRGRRLCPTANSGRQPAANGARFQ